MQLNDITCELSATDRELLLNWCESLAIDPPAECSLNIERINPGVSNHNFCLSAAEQRWFLQVRQPTHFPILNYQQRQIIDSEPSLKPFIAKTIVAGEQFLLQQWVEGQPIQQDDFQSDPFQLALIEFLLCLHSSPVSLPRLNMREQIKKLATQCSTTAIDATWLDLTTKQALVLAESFDARVACHNDLNPHNILRRQSSDPLKVVDWEYAAISDPAFEWAVLIEENRLTAGQWQPLLAAYNREIISRTGAGINQPLSANKIELMRSLYQQVAMLWFAANGQDTLSDKTE